jgi:ketosteroid isomerase-like protein
MSQENVEIARTFLDAINRSDWHAALASFTPDFEYDLTRAGGPYRGVYKLGQMRQVIDEFAGAWESARWEVDEFVEVGEHVVMPFTNYLRGRDGIEVQARATFVCTIRDGSIARLCLYQERQEALEAVGLPE